MVLLCPCRPCSSTSEIRFLMTTEIDEAHKKWNVAVRRKCLIHVCWLFLPNCQVGPRLL